MNKFKKIGLSALAGSLVAMAAHAEVSISGGASVALTKNNEGGATSYYQSDSFTLTYAGETDGGLNVSVSVEIDGDATGLSSGVDSESIKIGTDAMGTITYSGHGGDSVMSGWDDVTPSAYEEPWALVQNDAGTAATGPIKGFDGNSLWRYDSPNLNGAQLHVAYQAAAQTGNVSAYSDIGISYSPEMVDGLSLGYAQGSYDESASVIGLDVSTLWVKYAYGPVTVGYQTSEIDGPTVTQDDDTTSMGISYAISDSLSVSYNEHKIDNGGWSNVDQESTGISASYTMGGTTISATRNQVDNIGGVAAADEQGYEIALSFAF